MSCRPLWRPFPIFHGVRFSRELVPSTGYVRPYMQPIHGARSRWKAIRVYCARGRSLRLSSLAFALEPRAAFSCLESSEMRPGKSTMEPFRGQFQSGGVCRRSQRLIGSLSDVEIISASSVDGMEMLEHFLLTPAELHRCSHAAATRTLWNSSVSETFSHLSRVTDQMPQIPEKSPRG